MELVEGTKYARKCSVTGEGMNSGYCIGEGEGYAKDSVALQEHFKWNDDTEKQKSYDAGEYYWTEWEMPIEAQYIVKNGELVEFHKVMKFIPAEDSEVYQRLVSEDGKIEMGIYPVMYGYRVRAGYVGKMVCELDWCGGDDQSQLELLYSICKNILESKGNFDNIPIRSDIKPFYKDAKFVEEINSLTTKPLEIVKLEPLYESKNKLLKKR